MQLYTVLYVRCCLVIFDDTGIATIRYFEPAPDLPEPPFLLMLPPDLIFHGRLFFFYHPDPCTPAKLHVQENTAQHQYEYLGQIIYVSHGFILLFNYCISYPQQSR